MATEILRPNAVGLLAQFTASPAVPNWQNVDEVYADNNTTWNYSSYASYRDLYNISEPTFPDAAPINKVTLYARCRYYTPGTNYKGYYGLKSGATEDWGTVVSFGGWTTYSRVYATDPNTGSAWTKAAIAALQIGVKVYTTEPGLGITQIYVEVEYVVAYEKTLTESLGLVDSVIKDATLHPLTELLGLVDTVSKDTVLHDLAESLGLADTVVKMASIVKSEALGLTDTYSRVWTIYRTYTELLGLIDTYDRVWSAYRTYSELLGLLDTVTKSASIIKIEPLGLEDHVSKHPSKALTEVLGLLDSVTYSKNPTVLAKLIRKFIQLESIGGGGQN